MLLKKMLLCTDYSIQARQLYDCIPEFKKLGFEEIVLIHVVNIQSAGGNAHAFQEYNYKKLNEDKKQLEQMGFKVIVKVPIGFPAYEIIQIAESEEVSLILISSHGKGMIKSVFLGSTTFDVLRSASKPLLIEKYKNVESEECVSYCKQKFKKVLIPTDFSEASLKMIEDIKKITAIEEVILASVIEKSENSEDFENIKKELERKINAIKNEFEELGFKVDTRIRVGIASKNILEIAETEDVSLIALSRRGTGIIKELLIGSTAETIAKQSKCPVLVMPS